MGMEIIWQGEVNLKKAIDPFYLYEYSIRPYGPQGEWTILEKPTDARPIIVNVPPKRLKELLEGEEDVIVKKTVTWDKIIIEVLQVVKDDFALPSSFDELKQLYLRLREEYNKPVAVPPEVVEVERKLEKLTVRFGQVRKAWEQSLRCSVCGAPAVKVYETIFAGLYKSSDVPDVTTRFSCSEYEKALALEKATYLPESVRARAREVVREHFGRAKIIGDEALEKELRLLEEELNELSVKKRKLLEEFEEKVEERRALLRKKLRRVAKEILKMCREDSSLLKKISDEEYGKLLIDAI